MPVKKATKKTTPVTEPEAPAETREQKLQRLGSKRVTIALDKIRLIGNLAAYKPDDVQVDKICMAIADAAQRLEARLRGIRKDTSDFKL